MKFMLKLFFLILFIFVSSTIYSQNAIIKGKVMTSENGAAMPFILVSLNNTTHKYTDSKGMFVFENVSAEKYNLTFLIKALILDFKKHGTLWVKFLKLEANV